MIIEVTVVPKQGRFSVSFKDSKVKIFLKSAAEDNKANLELIKELKNRLNCEVRIISGHKSRRKKLEVGTSQTVWYSFIRSES